MTKLRPLALLPLAFAADGLRAQSATSIANGPFYMPTTWSCFCVPTPAMDLTVAHAVTLNNDALLGPGSITINAGAALVQDGTPRQMLMTGGQFTNHGTFGIDRMAVQGGSFTNTGTAAIRAQANAAAYINSGTITGMDTLFSTGSVDNSGQITAGTIYTGGSLINSGSILGVDSLYNAAYLEVTATGVLHSDSLYNADELVNAGTIETVSFTNGGTWDNQGTVLADDLLNVGTFENHGTVLATGSMSNQYAFTNNAGATVTLGESILNADGLLQPNAGVAIFTNHGQVDVGDSWYNLDQMLGSASGEWTVQDSTANLGTMAGPFHFCDLTPPAAWPFIDFNLGTVGSEVAFCQPTGMPAATHRAAAALTASPNPASDAVELRLEVATGGVVRIALLDARSAEVLLVHDGALAAGAHRIPIQVQGLAPGPYLVRLQGAGEQAVLRLAIAR